VVDRSSPIMHRADVHKSCRSKKIGWQNRIIVLRVNLGIQLFVHRFKRHFLKIIVDGTAHKPNSYDEISQRSDS
jgi:hypothetical protein